MQRRIVKDIIKMERAKGKDSLATWDMPAKMGAARNIVWAESYLRTMNSDSVDKTNRTTYYTNSAVLLI